MNVGNMLWKHINWIHICDLVLFLDIHPIVTCLSEERVTMTRSCNVTVQSSRCLHILYVRAFDFHIICFFQRKCRLFSLASLCTIPKSIKLPVRNLILSIQKLLSNWKNWNESSEYLLYALKPYNLFDAPLKINTQTTSTTKPNQI